MTYQNPSQLNRDYAKAMASRDHGISIRSARRGISHFILGLIAVFAVLLIFFIIKKPLLNHFHKTFSQVSTPVEKSKPVIKKNPISTSTSHIKQEYGFYTELPKVEIKSQHHEDSESKTSSEEE